MRTLLRVRRVTRVATLCLLAGGFAVPAGLSAQTHVVSPAELHQQTIEVTRSRQQNLSKVNDFLSSPKAGAAIASARLDPVQVKTAIAALSDQELAQLALRVDKSQADFAAGELSERDLLFIILGIAALVLIIVAVR